MDGFPVTPDFLISLYQSKEKAVETQHASEIQALTTQLQAANSKVSKLEAELSKERFQHECCRDNRDSDRGYFSGKIDALADENGKLQKKLIDLQFGPCSPKCSKSKKAKKAVQQFKKREARNKEKNQGLFEVRKPAGKRASNK